MQASITSTEANMTYYLLCLRDRHLCCIDVEGEQRQEGVQQNNTPAVA